MPEQVRHLQATLSTGDKAESLTESELGNKYIHRIEGKCAADQAKSTYTGNCPDRFADVVPNPTQYCSCMLTGVGTFSEADMREVGLESSDWVPRAVEAKKRGLAPPEQPALLKRYMGIDKSCRQQ